MGGLALLILLNPLDGQATDVGHAGFRAVHINVQLHVLSQLAHEVQASLVVGATSAHQDLHPGSLDVVRLLCHSLHDATRVLDQPSQVQWTVLNTDKLQLGSDKVRSNRKGQ